jgi:hypothetical protein
LEFRVQLARPVIAAAVGISLVIAGTAGAAKPKPKPKPKRIPPVCYLVTDPSGDTSVYPAGGIKDDAMDITSVDVASDKNSITGVIRIKKLAKSSSNAPLGMNWSVNFTADGVAFTLAGHSTTTGGMAFDTAYASAAGGQVYGAGTTGVFDTAKNEVRITAPLSLMSKQADILVGKTKITAIGGTTGPEVLVADPSGAFGGSTIFSDSYLTADSTASGKDYLAGTPSCVAVGK